jgi:phospholipid transport system substrate-binding protein
MKFRQAKTIFIAALMGFVFHGPGLARAETPADELRKTIDSLLTILRSPEFQGDAKKQERRTKLREIIYPRFDFAEMAQRSLGSHWRRRSPEQKKEFTGLFRNLLEEAYLDRIESYNGQKVQFVKETPDHDHAQVDTKIVDNKGTEFAINYRMHNVGGEWKVYDVIIENVSLVNNYRSQFNRLLAKSSYEDLVVALKEKKLNAPGAKS